MFSAFLLLSSVIIATALGGEPIKVRPFVFSVGLLDKELL